MRCRGAHYNKMMNTLQRIARQKQSKPVTNGGHRSGQPGSARQTTTASAAGSGHEWLSTGALIALLLAYANGSAWLATRRGDNIPVGLSRAHLTMLALILLWAWAERLDARELGLTWSGLRRGVVAGLLAGAAATVPIGSFFRLPLIARWPIAIGEYQGLRLRQVCLLVGGQFLVGSALFEEVAFRGLLHAKLRRLLGVPAALGIGSAVFAAWHAVIAWHNVRRCNVTGRWFGPFYGGVLAVLFAAGWLFGLVRQGTGHVGASVMTHWVLVIALLFEVMRLNRRQPECACEPSPSSE